MVLDKTKYLELTKTYRSSKEIIEYTNKILNLTFVSAIRKDNNKPVLFRKETNLKKQLLNDINYLKKFPKIGDKVARQIILDLKGNTTMIWK